MMKTAIVTGANSGIGKASTVQLVNRGWKVIMACRNPKKAEKALEEVKEITKRDSAEVMLLDMSSQSSIKSFVDQFKSKFDNLHLLINNAATFNLAERKPEITEDGFEKHWATNHLGQVLITTLLLPILEKSKPSRILNIASMGLMTYPFLKLNYSKTTNPEGKFSVQNEYYHSKQAQVMYTYELSKRLEGSGITVNVIRVPNVRIPISKLQEMGIPNWKISVYKLKSKFALTPDKMAETYVSLGIDDEFKDISGKYITEKFKFVKSNKYSKKPENWKLLWDTTYEQLKMQSELPELLQ